MFLAISEIACQKTSGQVLARTNKELTLNKLELVPMTNPTSSNPVIQEFALLRLAFRKEVPTYVRLIIADKFGSYDPNSNGVIFNSTNQK
jgi:hypothetical protein